MVRSALPRARYRSGPLSPSRLPFPAGATPVTGRSPNWRASASASASALCACVCRSSVPHRCLASSAPPLLVPSPSAGKPAICPPAVVTQTRRHMAAVNLGEVMMPAQRVDTGCGPRAGASDVAKTRHKFHSSHLHAPALAPGIRSSPHTGYSGAATPVHTGPRAEAVQPRTGARLTAPRCPSRISPDASRPRPLLAVRLVREYFCGSTTLSSALHGGVPGEGVKQAGALPNSAAIGSSSLVI